MTDQDVVKFVNITNALVQNTRAKQSAHEIHAMLNYLKGFTFAMKVAGVPSEIVNFGLTTIKEEFTRAEGIQQ
jgi:hypothetical protein